MDSGEEPAPGRWRCVAPTQQRRDEKLNLIAPFCSDVMPFSLQVPQLLVEFPGAPPINVFGGLQSGEDDFDALRLARCLCPLPCRPLPWSFRPRLLLPMHESDIAP